ncbi:ATP-binding cassette domain-containing protein [Kineococcus esterisolvens]|uniref:ATP-binding cassette domain-containing protein n=1 Tax=unclassified Kineococcus TaxID=2621656 RepID=UPI003D7D65AD
MITLTGLTKRYGTTTAVEDLTVEVRPGQVTGFLGPNGAGKSTTMRMIVGLDHPSAGQALVLGRPYASLSSPLRHVGALLDDASSPSGRTATAHLLATARSNRIPARRVSEVLDVVGLGDVAGRRVTSFSLGMRQRLGIATALLGDPAVLLFDEPVNGLDPDGVRWIRDLMRSMSAEGRTVLVSSHLMSEMQQTADHLVVLGRGRLLADAPLQEVIGAATSGAVRVRSPRADVLADGLTVAGFTVDRTPGGLLVSGASSEEIGDLAHRLDAPVHELSRASASLEQAYLQLTGGEVEYAARSVDPAGEGA